MAGTREDEARGEVRAWVITDGKIGDEVQCIGVVEALGLVPDLRRVAPRRPWSWLAPRGPVDPRERPGRAGGPLEGPLPDLAIASGRRAMPHLRALSRASKGAVFTVCLKDPRIGTRAADLICLQAHDRLRGDNVIVTPTAPHRVSPARLAAFRERPDPRLAPLPAPRIAVAVGGDSGHHRFTGEDEARLLAQLRALSGEGSLMITPSRRTSPALAAGLAQLARETNGFFYDGTGENPYAAMLAIADAVVVTADSTNMLGEAAASGAPVLVFTPTGGHRKIDALLAWLTEQGVARPLAGRLEGARTAPIDATPEIAARIAQALDRHRVRRGLPALHLAGTRNGEE